MQKFAIIGLGRFGERLARSLASAGAEVIAIDRHTRHVEAMRDHVTIAVRLDATDADSLRSQGVQHVDVAVVGIGEEFESSALTVAALRELGVKHIIARAMTDVQGRILQKVGADEIAQPESESAVRWAHRLMLPNLTQYIELGDDHSIIYRTPPTVFLDQPLSKLNLRNEFGVNLVAIERRVTRQTEEDRSVDELQLEIPRANTVIKASDILVLIGSNESLAGLPES
ncbi:MAG: potassium channel family protein [Phycisphaerae bacterium]